MRRRNAGNEGLDSLELLLDTICNTFGGVLFMAMLIALLSGKRAAPADEQARARQNLEALARVEARETLAADAATDARKAATHLALARADVAAVAGALGWSPDRVRALALQYSGKADAVRTALGDGRALAELDRDAAAKTAEAGTAQAALDRQQARTEAAERAVAAAREKSRVTLRMPAAHETTKRQAVAYVVGGRLYAGVYPDERFRYAAPLYRGHTDGDGQSVKPADLPAALGSPPLTTLAAAQAAVAAQDLAGLDAGTTYIVFAVWPDSHEAFRLLREAVTARNLGYGLMLMEADEPVTFGGGGTRYEQ